MQGAAIRRLVCLGIWGLHQPRPLSQLIREQFSPWEMQLIVY